MATPEIIGTFPVKHTGKTPADDYSGRAEAKYVMVLERLPHPTAIVPVAEFPYIAFVCGNIPLSDGDSVKFFRDIPSALAFAEAEAATF